MMIRSRFISNIQHCVLWLDGASVAYRTSSLTIAPRSPKEARNGRQIPSETALYDGAAVEHPDNAATLSTGPVVERKRRRVSTRFVSSYRVS
jgi:hypothetical protein